MLNKIIYKNQQEIDKQNGNIGETITILHEIKLLIREICWIWYRTDAGVACRRHGRGMNVRTVEMEKY